jgi:hypothetical protein
MVGDQSECTRLPSSAIPPTLSSIGTFGSTRDMGYRAPQYGGGKNGHQSVRAENGPTA